jgi:hypothetical protein
MENDKFGIVGKGIGEAADTLDAADHTYRVVERDGKRYMVTADHVPTRVNLTMRDKVVVSYTFG